MNNYTFTKQNDLFPTIDNRYRFYINDDLLYDCIGIGRNCSHDPKRVTGFNAGKQFGYALLTYFTTRALNIHRIPFCEDRIYCNYFNNHSNYDNILSEIDIDRMESICNEINKLYQNTQSHLKEKSIDHVYLGRKISGIGGKNSCYAKSIIEMKRAAEITGLTSLKIEMDTLNSFSDEGGYSGDIFLEMKIPAKDIFYCSNLIANRSGKSETVETGEWVVLNRSPTGVVKLPISSIHIDYSNWKEIPPMTTQDAKIVLENYSPFVIRELYRTEPTYNPNRIHTSLKGRFLSFLLKKIYNY
ncbi:TPA: hypothetical protein ACOEF8_003530 [Enterobacter roggenkampii]